MRDPHAALKPFACRSLRTAMIAALSAAALSACAGPRMGPGGPPGGARGDRPPPPSLFVSPFGEPFVAAPGQPWPVTDWFLGADDDLDGVIGIDEFTADGRRWFAQLDADRDGRLGQAELWAYEARLAALGGARGGDDGARGGGRRGPQTSPSGASLGLAGPQSGSGGRPQRGGGRGGSGERGSRGYGMVAEAGFFNLPQPVKAADVNIDQRVTAEEWAAATQRWFLALDTDRDGRLTLATLPKTPLQQRAEARR